MLGLTELPTWVQVLRLIITFFVCAGCGVHAYAMFKIHSLVARRWMFLLYSLVFLFTGLFVFVYLMIAVQMRDYRNGPVQLGTFSLMLICSYLALTYGVASRNDLEWSKTGQDQRI